MAYEKYLLRFKKKMNIESNFITLLRQAIYQTKKNINLAEE